MKPKKNIRQRGHKTHGWGSKKKHRGAGNRGGRGNAGSGKRADQKKPSYWNSLRTKKESQKHGQNYFGKFGFGMNAHTQENSSGVTITVRDLDTRLPRFIAEKKATEKNGVYTIDLTSAGIAKLLGTGQIRKKVQVTVRSATASAVAKVEAVGGSVLVTPSTDAASSKQK
jgi:large subunit ribosomal protein L15